MFIIGKEEEKDYELDLKGVNNLRGLGIDMIKNANSGHSGITLGAASIIYTLFKYHMNLDLNNLDFVNRDRFILSAGHGAPLLYGIDYFLGLLELDDLKNLRKINSKCPGHPEYSLTPLVEFTSGALGQGLGTAVGLSIGERYQNKKTNGLIDHYTYVLCGDGELEEGITYEALNIASKLNLNKLIVLVDYNKVTLDNNLEASNSEDIKKRFESLNFNILEANDSVKEINECLENAKKSNRPSVIIVNTKIGLYSKLEGTNKVHGVVLDDEDILSVKEKLGLFESSFTVNSSVIEDFKKYVFERGQEKVKEFNEQYDKLENKSFIKKIINKEVCYSIKNLDIEYNESSLRDLSGEILNSVANDFDLVIGGSADLSSSCKTNLKECEVFAPDNYLGRNIYYGIREHAMGAITNGLALLGLRPFASTFLVFSDYMRTSLRESALMDIPSLFIFTHDSILVGEDGPLHQPIEQLASLELIPNLKIYRPYDLNELIGCYIDIFNNSKPSCLIIPRNNKEISSDTKSNGIENGIYEVIPNETNSYINLISNGEELGIVLRVSKRLKEYGIDTRVLSVPCKKNIKDLNILNKKKTIAITLGCKEYFYDITKDVFGINEFGKSGTKEELLEYFGFTEEKIVSKILELVKK